MKTLFVTGVALVAGCAFLMSTANASPLCTTGSVKLTSLTTLAADHSNTAYDSDYFTDNNLLKSDYIATNCMGLFSEPSNIGSIIDKADPNRGWLGDGLLNGGIYSWGGQGPNAQTKRLIDPEQFLKDATGLDDISGLLMGLKDKDDPVDPGWITLGKQDIGSAFSYESIKGSNPLDLADVLDIRFDCTGDCKTGTWSLVTTPDIISLVQGALGDNRSTFDMLAFTFKAGTEWAVFNFNFAAIFQNEIFNLGNTGLDAPFNTPFAFAGTWDTSVFGSGLSHVGVAARDPIQTTTTTPVPTPASIAIMGIGLLALRLFRR
ncbi:hypothetical protein QWY20_02860 [Alkalimonas sp. MEB108]|uniref:PEP-CTERM protein-sorting domain-containing protein n=1 Tax=Alkalimonas cellulosilytica TaxID=3058395 RepID=A0ABU7J1M5_9GAMM|nr:hypothetical protein [Alkalimonas sp. MEB108]MEE2000381.1 hypothetical protein [Alkalimonas sp. MEB108]